MTRRVPAARPAPSRFPDPRTGPGGGPVAAGGDLEPDTLVDAYAHGIFPWPDTAGRLWWWSPDPRGVLPLDGLHVSRSLRRTLRRRDWEPSFDRSFDAVVAACADRPGEGTWINPAMVRAYGRLHRLGLAHSVEVWDGGALVGGLYGVTLGGAFMGESMFHRATGASKFALVALVDRLTDRGFVLLDVQLPTPHLVSLGTVALPRDAFLDRLAEALTLRTDFAPSGFSATSGWDYIV